MSLWCREDKTDLQICLGMINYLPRYIPDRDRFIQQNNTIRKLVDQNVLFMWSNSRKHGVG